MAGKARRSAGPCSAATARNAYVCRMRHALAICVFLGIWWGVWSGASLAGLYVFDTYELPALIGGFVGIVGGAVIAHVLLTRSYKEKGRPPEETAPMRARPE